MDDQTNRTAPCYRSAQRRRPQRRGGRVHDAQTVHAKARRMLADYQAARSAA